MKKFTLPIICMLSAVKCLGINWETPMDITESENLVAPSVAINHSGDAMAIWLKIGSNVSIQSSTYTGAWEKPVDISNIGFNADSPDFAMNRAADTAVAVWVTDNNGNTNYVIQTSTYSSGSWGTPQTISSLGANAYEPKIAINASGDGFAIWKEVTFGYSVVMVASFSNGTWHAPQLLSGSTAQCFNPTIALNDSGQAIAVWIDGNTIRGSYYHSGKWDPEQTISKSESGVSFPDVVINSTGVGFAIWAMAGENPLTNEAIAVSRFNGTWDIEQVISRPNDNVMRPSIAINDLGNAIAGWSNAYPSSNAMVTTFTSGIWSSPEVISTLSVNSNVKVGIDGSDHVIAVWSALLNNQSAARCAGKASDTWSSPSTISDCSAQSPSLAMNTNGDAVVVWNSYNGTDYRIQGVIGRP